jgi:hypothetical protein
MVKKKTLTMRVKNLEQKIKINYLWALLLVLLPVLISGGFSYYLFSFDKVPSLTYASNIINDSLIIKVHNDNEVSTSEIYVYAYLNGDYKRIHIADDDILSNNNDIEIVLPLDKVFFDKKLDFEENNITEKLEFGFTSEEIMGEINGNHLYFKLSCDKCNENAAPVKFAFPDNLQFNFLIISDNITKEIESVTLKGYYYTWKRN